MSEEDSNEAATYTAETIELVARHSLELRRGPEDNVLRVLSPDGQARLSIVISAKGIALSVKGGDLVLDTIGALAISAEHISLHGRKGVEISTDGDTKLRATGDIHSEARVQNIKANLGNVNIKANDDVKLNGERIKLNA